LKSALQFIINFGSQVQAVVFRYNTSLCQSADFLTPLNHVSEMHAYYIKQLRL